MGTHQTPKRSAKDLIDGLSSRPYLFVEHTLSPSERSSWRSHGQDYRSFLVIGGQVEIKYVGEDGEEHSEQYGHLQGWHASPDAVYCFANAGIQQSVLLEAGTISGRLQQADRPDDVRRGAPIKTCTNVSDYKVKKPWGYEIWYTHNLPEQQYALKQIYMKAGHQSSLQSHQKKVETNYVIKGEATVLNGVIAPDDLMAAVDISKLPRAIYRPRSGWSSAPRILHRVIAQVDYTSVEVSTPELDDVIRWADDTGRGNGRIEPEHEGGRL